MTSEAIPTLNFTGERIIPELNNYFFFEHLARYRLAKRFARPDSRVLDVGCGDGYGSFFLAGHASTVLGIDIDAATVEHAQRKYRRDNSEYRLVQPDAWVLPESHFDLITCFEVFEHVAEPNQLLARISRALADNGVAIISTPNKEVYGDHLPDPYHLKEYTLDEFIATVERELVVDQVLGQSNENQIARKLNFFAARQAMRFPLIMRLANLSLPRQTPTYRTADHLDGIGTHGNVFSSKAPEKADYFLIVARKRRL